jgi:hypothetical protein
MWQPCVALPSMAKEKKREMKAEMNVFGLASFA